MRPNKEIRGLLGQRLDEGDVIAFVARSGSYYRQCIAKIVSISDSRVVVETGGKCWRRVGESEWKESFKRYKVRIYNYSSAITLDEQVWDDFISSNGF